MKRSALARRTPLRRASLARTATLDSRPRVRTPEPAERAWKRPRYGRCESCGLIDTRPLHGHHIIARQVVARAGGDEWNPANRLDLCARCHFNHEFGQANRKIAVDRIPERALAFAVDVLGEAGAADYIRRHYA